jgi:hypothetical protein
MVADYFTKPLQGQLFYKFRDQIMGLVPMDTIHGNHRSVLDHDYMNPESPQKPRKVSRAINSHSTSGTVNDVSRPESHKSWADMVRYRSPTKNASALVMGTNQAHTLL